MVHDPAMKAAMKRLNKIKPPAPADDDSDVSDSESDDEILKGKKKEKKPAPKQPPQAGAGGAHASLPPSQQGGASKRKSKQDSDSEDDAATLREIDAEVKRQRAKAPDKTQREFDSSFHTLLTNIRQHKEEMIILDEPEPEVVEAPTQPLASPRRAGRGSQGKARRGGGSASKSPSKSPAAPRTAPGKRYVFVVKEGGDTKDATQRRINENDTMSKVMEAYAKHNGLDVGSLRFFDPDGNPLKPDQLCKTLVDLDEEPEPNFLTCDYVKGYVPPPANLPGARFLFTVKLPGIDDPSKMRVKEDAPMSKVMENFCQRHQLDENAILFKFDGQVVQPNATAKSLDPEPDDEVNQLDAVYKHR
mmetsp:Transcript_15066/g.37691  ORF Transcript_15066/g.37691 Transcript_15066/m.37691 type:complete len:360 (+) Transcript_15066:366-1445(+)